MSKPKIKQQMQNARALIKQKRYAEARSILRRVDHPKAREWLVKLDQIDPRKEEKESTPRKRWVRRGCVYPLLLVLVLLCGSALLLTPSAEEIAATEGVETGVALAAEVTSKAQATLTTWTPSPEPSATDTSLPTATLTNTPLPTATLTALGKRVLEVDGIESVVLSRLTTSGVYIEACANDLGIETARRARRAAHTEVGPVNSFSIILDAGNSYPIDYNYSGFDWIVTPLTTVNGPCVNESTVDFETLTPTLSVTLTLRPRPTRAPQQQSVRRPSNCDDARSMGLSARQAGAYSHLDRDNDGVACYGD